MKKWIVVFLSLVLVCTALLPASAAAVTPAEQAHLHFNENGKFRILNFSDFQDDILLSGHINSRNGTTASSSIPTATPSASRETRFPPEYNTPGNSAGDGSPIETVNHRTVP